MKLIKCKKCNGKGHKETKTDKRYHCSSKGKVEAISKKDEVKINGKVFGFQDTKEEIARALAKHRTLMVPRVSKESGFTYYLLSDMKEILTKSELKAFHYWMWGQTCPVVEIDGKQECAYYSSDVGRFFVVRYGGWVLWD